MYKIKTHSGAKKRFKVTGTGKVLRANANKNHILTKKNKKRKRNLRKIGVVSVAETANMKELIPYK